MAVRPLNSVAGYSVGEYPSTTIVDANGNVFANNLTVSAVANLGSVSNVIITGGTSGYYLQTNGSGNLTWAAVASGNGISNGTSNVSIPTSGGNVVIYVNGNNTANITSTGANITGTLNVSGNANVGNIGTTQVLASANITTPQFISNVSTGTAPLVVSSTTLVSNLNADLLDGYNTATANTASTVVVRDANGNISANYFIGDGSQLTGLSTSSISNGTSNVNIPAINGNVNISAAGSANVLVVTSTGVNVAGTLNTNTGNANVGNIGTAQVLASANVTAPQLISNVATGTAPFVVSSTTRVTNLNVANAGFADAATNATAVQTNTSTSSTVYLAGVTSSSNGNSALNIVTGVFANMSNNAITATTFIGNIQGGSGNSNVGNIGATLFAGNLSGSGNSNVGNLGTTGIIIASDNITSNANLVSDNILGRTGALTITSAGTNTNINLKPNGTGNIDANSASITNVKDPINPQDAATKNYVDAAVTGLHVHDSCYVATTGTLATASGGTTTYDNGVSGVGATITTTGTYLLIDGGNVQTVGTRVLVKNEANAAWNGIYTYTSTTVLTRATDFDTSSEAAGGDFVFVTSGSTQADTGWVQTTDNPTLGSSNIVWTQFSGAGTYTAGTGLTLTGTVFSITNTTVTPATYGNGDRVASFTVNAQGQLTAASNVVIAANAANLTGTTLASSIVGSSLTSVGTLSTLNVSGNANVGNLGFGSGVITGTGNITGGNLLGVFANGTSNVSIPAVNGNVNISAAGTPNVIVITSTGANITGTLDTGTGNASFGNVSATNGNLTTANISGNVILGNSSVTTVVSYASVTTTAVTANQTIASFSVTGVTGVEFLVKGIDSAGSKYSVSTVQAVTDGSSVDYTTYAGVTLGGYTGTFAVNIVGGQVRLQVTPSSSNSTVWTTQYRFI